MSENIFIEALQEINKQNIQHGECSVTFTYHDGRVVFYTVHTSERHNVAQNKRNLMEDELCIKAI